MQHPAHPTAALASCGRGLTGLLRICTLALMAAPAVASAQTTPPTAPQPRYSSVYPTIGGGWGPKVGDYWSSAWVETWPTSRRDSNDIADKLKAVPLSADGSVTLTIDGQERLWVDSDDEPALKPIAPHSNTVLLRSVLGAGVDIADIARGYVQVANGLATGHDTMAFQANNDNTAIILQAFGEVHGTALGGNVGALVGRMEFWDGPPQLIAVRDRPNIRTSWTGGRAYGEWRHIRFDLFRLMGTTFGKAAFDDPVNPAERLSGVVVGTDLAPSGLKPTLFLDGFYYNYAVNRAWGGKTSRDARDIYGLYLRGRAGAAQINASAIKETGTFNGRSVSADAQFARVSYTLSHLPLKPSIGVRFDRATGGGAYGNGTLHDFNLIHGVHGLIDYSNALTYTNTRMLGPQLSFSPTRAVTIALEANHVDRVASGDAVYSGGDIAYAGTQLVDGNDVGTLYRASAIWTIGRHLTWQLSYDRLSAGKILRGAGYGTQNFIRSLMTLRY